MRITWLEMKKALFSPTILILLALFILFNIFTIVSGSYIKDELKIVNMIVQKYGDTFNDDVLNMMQEDLNANTQKIDAQFNDANTFLEAMTHEKYTVATVNEQQEIDRISLIQMYLANGESLDKRYATLDIEALKKGVIADYGFTGWSVDFMTKEYDKFSDRLTEMKKNGEYKEWFFAGNYRMHSELFSILMKNIAMESVLLVVLLTVLITNYEFEHRTQLVTYATKKGRHLTRNKLFASLLATFLVLLPLFGLSLLTFFTVYDYSGLWKTLISSGLNWEYKWPYITWWPVELWQYLLLTIVILVMTLLLISTLTFCMSTFVKNSYISWILCILLLVSMFVVPSFFIGMPIILLIMQLNLTLLLLNPHMYFNGVSGLTMFEYHEIWTLALWWFISILCTIFALKRFKRKDIV